MEKGYKTKRKMQKKNLKPRKKDVNQRGNQIHKTYKLKDSLKLKH